VQGEIVPYLYLRGYHRVTGAGRENMGLQIGNNVKQKERQEKGKGSFRADFRYLDLTPTGSHSLARISMRQDFSTLLGIAMIRFAQLFFPRLCGIRLSFFFFFFTYFFTPRQHAWQISVYWASRILTINKFNLETSISALKLQTACLLTSTGRQYTQMTA